MFWLRSRYHLPIESELKRHTLRGVAYFLLLAVLLSFYVFAVGCTEERSPTAAPVILATPTPAPIPTPTPVVVSTPAPSLKHDWWFRADGSFCVTNHSGGTTSFQACARRVYPGGDQDFSSTDAIVPGGWIPDGDTFCGRLAITWNCYTELEVLEQPNTCNDFKQIVGARYLNVGQYCARATPPPTPTPRSLPTPSPTPSSTPTPAPTPTPCPAAHFTGEAVVATAGTFSAMAQATGSGNWKLSIYATSDLAEYQANQPDYVKDTDAATTTCETAATLSVSYGWQGHPARYWWGDLKLNGARVWKSAVVEHAP